MLAIASNSLPFAMVNFDGWLICQVTPVNWMMYCIQENQIGVNQELPVNINGAQYWVKAFVTQMPTSILSQDTCFQVSTLNVAPVDAKAAGNYYNFSNTIQSIATERVLAVFRQWREDRPLQFAEMQGFMHNRLHELTQLSQLLQTEPQHGN